MAYTSESGVISKKIVVIGLSGLLIIGSLFIAVSSRQGRDANTQSDVNLATTPIRAADQFLQAAIKLDGRSSYASFTNKLQKEYSQGGWQAQLNSVFKGYGNSPPVLGNTETVTKSDDGSPLSQRLTYNLIFDKLGDEANVPYVMIITVVKEGNSWKIDEFNSIET
ncbi:MAG TPA: NTF2-like N-terminal transpeptidase domain-containing protein [Candidatus Saccharimonadales bacterium]